MIRNLILLAAGLLLLAGCNKEEVPQDDAVPGGGGGMSEEKPDKEPVGERIPVRIATFPGTRVTDAYYETGDQVGIFMVNYEDGIQSQLLQSGNYIDNLCFTYNGSQWNSTFDTYWKDERIPADFYCYFPYMRTVSDIHSVPFSVRENQRSPYAYKSSEFLYGRTLGAKPSMQVVDIMTNHSMSSLLIYLKPGKGYTEESLAAEKIDIVITGVRTDAFIDLATGKVTPSGDYKDIIPCREHTYWKALVVPQEKEEGQLLKVKVGDYEYTYSQSITFKSNCKHQCTLTVNRLGNGINIGIGDWETDDTDFEGVLD